MYVLVMYVYCFTNIVESKMMSIHSNFTLAEYGTPEWFAAKVCAAGEVSHK